MYATKSQSRTSTEQEWGDYLESFGIHILMDYITFGVKAGILRPADAWRIL